MLKRILLFISILVLLICFAVLQAESAELEIKSSVDKSEVSVGQTFNFKVQINGNIGKAPKIKLPDLKESFDVISSGQSQRITFGGGKRNLIIAYEFILKPREAGEFTIEEAQIAFQGEIYKTQPIQIQVLPADESEDLPEQPEEPEEIKSPDGGLFI